MRQVKNLPETKLCKYCERVLPAKEFNGRKHVKGDTEYYNLYSFCKQCGNAFNRAWQKTEKGKACQERYRSKPEARAREKEQKKDYVKTKRAKKLRREAIKRYRDKPEAAIKIQAQQRVQYAVKTGKLERMPCVKCGDPNTHAHHFNYTKPLDVIWLCPLHHKEEHRENRV